MTIWWFKTSQKCKLCLWWRWCLNYTGSCRIYQSLATEQLFSHLNSIKPASYRWNQIEIILSTVFSAAQLATVNFPQYPKGELNSGQGFVKVNCIFQINGNKGSKLERNKPDVFFLGRFSATFKSEHHCQCCIVRCYLFVCLHCSYG